MTHVILGHCCKDASCIQVCPQNCIRPTPSDPEFDTVEHLYIDPDTCIDCSACVQACPAGAIPPASAPTPGEGR
ncbi:4Fe-4S dicluster domain-containing protein [Nocardia abscessus]|uniref:4Fe-4S dicluster domain-containing protein n=1 Tax=Nocardia abscessus TaxID=120957 RepID=UPI003CC7D969